MKFTPHETPRRFEVGRANRITIRDCARIELDADEQVTFVSESGAEYDVCRKDWGYYATPSTNGRLARFNLRTALVKSSDGRLYVMLAERDRKPAFRSYLEAEGHEVLCWLDTTEAVAALARLCSET